MDITGSIAKSITPFVASDFQDVRLFARSNAVMDALVRSQRLGDGREEAERKAFARFFSNERINATRLLRVSGDSGLRAMLGHDIVLCAEDTSLVRAGGSETPSDAGALRNAFDRGYVLHAAFAVDALTGKPIGWLGGNAWTRGDTLHHQDHKIRPSNQRESMKWPQLRRQLHRDLKQLEFKGQIIHINDAEGDAWNSLSAAQQDGHQLLTRATHDRRIVESSKKLKKYITQKGCTFRTKLTLHSRTPGQKRERTAEVRVQWKQVTLIAPKSVTGNERKPIRVTAIHVVEDQAPRKHKRFESWLLTTCPIHSHEDAAQCVGWYGQRWGIEVAFDVLKNGLNMEEITITDIAGFRRLVAVSAPVAAHIASWLAEARKPEPVKVGKAFTKKQLKDLELACTYFHVTVPREWTMQTVVVAIAKMAGADARPSRLPGWRNVYRGWLRLQEFVEIRSYRPSKPTPNTKPKPQK